MSEFTSALKPYDIETALAADLGEDCLIIDVGTDKNGHPVASLKHVAEQVDHYVHPARAQTFAATKLYIIGRWDPTPSGPPAELESKSTEIKKKLGDRMTQWAEATQKICKLLEQMDALKEVTWISELPFTAAVWAKLPISLTKLVLDLGEDQGGDEPYKTYITPGEMEPLREMLKLKELRLLRMYHSFQLLVWETVYRNTSDGGMRILDLQMAEEPIVRSGKWKKANDVAGLTVPTEESADKMYKGIQGKGVLHYTIGTGEYLDDFCIRKARITAGLEVATPLPLWCLKVDGFVIDHLPFVHDLSRIVLLTCGEKCIDSGLRAPKTDRAPRNKWSKAVNNATSHCLIKWPNWAGIFDDHGDQRNKLGVVVPQEMAFSISIDSVMNSPVAPLTEESLKMKTLEDALADMNLPAHSVTSTLAGAGAQTNLETVSNKSQRGSDVLTPTALSLATPTDHAADGSMISPTDGIVVVDGTGESSSPTSTATSSFEHVSYPVSPVDSKPENTGSDTPAEEEDLNPTKATFAQKAKIPLSWFT